MDVDPEMLPSSQRRDRGRLSRFVKNRFTKQQYLIDAVEVRTFIRNNLFLDQIKTHELGSYAEGFATLNLPPRVLYSLKKYICLSPTCAQTIGLYGFLMVSSDETKNRFKLMLDTYNLSANDSVYNLCIVEESTFVLSGSRYNSFVQTPTQMNGFGLNDDLTFTNDEILYHKGMPLSTWPLVAYPKKTRSPDNWPSETAKRQICRLGCHLEHVENRSIVNGDTCFTLNFDLAEQELVKSFSSRERYVYGILTFISDSIFPGNISPKMYKRAIKHTLFWSLQESFTGQGSDEDLIAYIHTINRKLQRSVSNGTCQNFFVKEWNIFEETLTNNDAINDILYKLRQFNRNWSVMFLYPNFQSLEDRMLTERNDNVQQKLLVQKEYIYNVYQELKCLEGVFVSATSTLSFAGLNTRIQLVLTGLRSDPGNDAICRARSYICFLFGPLLQTQNCRTVPESNRSTYAFYRYIENIMVQGIQFNIVSGGIRLLMFLLSRDKITESKHMVLEIQKRINEVKFKVKVNAHNNVTVAVESVGSNSRRSAHSEGHRNVEIFKVYTLIPYVLYKQERGNVPTMLARELDMQLDNRPLILDPVVVFSFLKVLLSYQSNNCELMRSCIIELETQIERTSDNGNKSAYFNMLGGTFLVCGDNHSARRCFRTSLVIKQTPNMAIEYLRILDYGTSFHEAV